MPTINLPEDVILASLQYSEGNDRWVNRAKDKSSNKLHVIIKPMLEQCTVRNLYRNPCNTFILT